MEKYTYNDLVKAVSTIKSIVTDIKYNGEVTDDLAFEFRCSIRRIEQVMKKKEILDSKLKDLEILAKLKLDIIQNGKIRQEDINDPDGIEYPYPCKQDQDRVKALESIQEKYTYGWYIATETLEEQLSSITKFEQYILDYNGDKERSGT